MARASASRWQSLERWSPTAFLVAGVLLTAYAALNGVAAATETAYVTVENTVGPAGFVLGFVGLLGLVPRLANRSPWSARVGAICAALGAMGFSVSIVGTLAELVGAEPADVSTWIAASLVLIVAGMLLGFIALGVASLRSGAHSRRLGLLLLAPPVIFAVMLSQAALFEQFGMFSEAAMAWSAFAISGGQAAVHLAIGRHLRITADSTDREIAPADATAS